MFGEKLSALGEAKAKEANDLRDIILKNVLNKIHQLEWMAIMSWHDNKKNNYRSVPWSQNGKICLIEVSIDEELACRVIEQKSCEVVYEIIHSQEVQKIWKALNDLFAKGGEAIKQRSEELLKAEAGREEMEKWNKELENLRAVVDITK